MTNDRKTIDIDYGASGGFDIGAPDYRSEPRITVDHGRQPRIGRPTPEVFKRDPSNRYRPTKVAFDPEKEWRDLLESRERNVARLLTKIAREHAPKLSRYRDDHIPSLIQRQGILTDARFVAGVLPPEVACRVIEKFQHVLWEEIRLFRKFHKNTKS